MTEERHQEERTLVELMEGLEPSPEQVRRMEQVITERLEAPAATSLVTEWIELLRIRPLSTPALALAGCAGIFLLSPLSGVLFTALG